MAATSILFSANVAEEVGDGVDDLFSSVTDESPCESTLQGTAWVF